MLHFVKSLTDTYHVPTKEDLDLGTEIFQRIFFNKNNCTGSRR